MSRSVCRFLSSAIKTDDSIFWSRIEKFNRHLPNAPEANSKKGTKYAKTVAREFDYSMGGAPHLKRLSALKRYDPAKGLQFLSMVEAMPLKISVGAQEQRSATSFLRSVHVRTSH